MIRPWLLFVAVLTGCAATHKQAPIREAGSVQTSRVTKGTDAAPTVFYRVQPGDTLYKIAFEHRIDVNDLVAVNQLADPTHIKAGDLLRIPPPTGRSAHVASRPNVTAGEVRSRPAEPTLPPPAAEVDPDSWNWPCMGELLVRFGDGANKGIDIGGSVHQPVYSAASGTVVYAGSGLRGYGKLIIIRHGRTLLSAYAHNARILVQEGQSVRRGQQIAEMGNTDADRVKLHFEIREHGNPVDPLNYLPKPS